MDSSQLILDQTTYERKERQLLVYYDRLKQIDKINRDLTSFFAVINIGVLAVVFELVTGDWQRLILAFVGYSASVALMLIGYKNFWAWRAYEKEMLKLEAKLDYGIAKKYGEKLALHKSPARSGLPRYGYVSTRFLPCCGSSSSCTSISQPLPLGTWNLP